MSRPVSRAASPGKITGVSSPSEHRRLTTAERQRAAAAARGSVLAEGLDPSDADAHVDAWTRGEIPAAEMVKRTLSDVAERHGHPADASPPAAA